MRQPFNQRMHWMPWMTWVAALALIAVSLALTFRIEPTAVVEYARYAHEGLLPPLLTHWPVEYPTLSEAVFLLPRLLPFRYALAFGLVAGGAFLVLLSQVHDPGWKWRTVLYFGCGALAVLTGRYDVFAVLAATLGIEAARREHFSWAWFWLATGFLLKLYPLIFMPVLFIWQYRRQGRVPWRQLIITILTTALILEVEYRWAGPGALSPYQFLDHRPLEIGSVPGDLAALLDAWHVRMAFAFGAMNIFTPATHLIAEGLDGVMVLSLLGVFYALYSDRIDLISASLLVLTILLLTSKVFSVQYMMWISPLWAYYPLNRYWVASALLATAAYPIAYLHAVHHASWWAIVVVLFGLRSLALLLGTLTVLRRPDRTLSRR